MGIINSLIDWRKGIEHVEHFGCTFYFKYDTSFEELMRELKMRFDLLQDENFKRFLLDKEIVYFEDIYGSYYSFDAWLNNDKLQKFKFSLSKNIIKNKRIERIVLDLQSSFEEEDFIESVCKLDGFNFAICYNPLYSSWENRKHINSYKYTKGLKTYFDSSKGLEFVDLSSRAGRILELGNFRWSGGYQYWFNSKFISSLIDEDDIDYNQFKIEEIANTEILKIEICEMKEYWNDNNQMKLSQLKKCLDIDNLQRTYQSSL